MKPENSEEECPTPEEHECVWDNETKCRCCTSCVFHCLEEGFKNLETVT